MKAEDKIALLHDIAVLRILTLSDVAAGVGPDGEPLGNPILATVAEREAEEAARRYARAFMPSGDLEEAYDVIADALVRIDVSRNLETP